MGRIPTDLTGKEFGRLRVIASAGKIGKNCASLCKCSCGNEKVVLNFNLGKGTNSCGCLQKETASETAKKYKPRLKHGLKGTITYNSWQGMLYRCYNEKHREYPRYGGRGITVCPEWRDPEKGLDNFVQDMGHRPSPAHTIDRIKSDRGYEPGNCRWATKSQQSQNVGLKKSNTSGYKGISPCGEGWKAEIRHDGKKFHLGVFRTKEEAALAYNVASEKLHGVYGVRNVLSAISRKVTKLIFDKVNSVLTTK